mmetsp:Transcript_27612/g.54279  ORF Transcript_27612/g.54279 Transcript_27612/m.54279 type:complete len:131 (+) Transcript_27612:29-421(+)
MIVHSGSNSYRFHQSGDFLFKHLWTKCSEGESVHVKNRCRTSRCGKRNEDSYTNTNTTAAITVAAEAKVAAELWTEPDEAHVCATLALKVTRPCFSSAVHPLNFSTTAMASVHAEEHAFALSNTFIPFLS